jgi:hypothetical protein
MKTYLLFFGKSQDFTTFAFDNHDSIDDFNSVIKDFNLLESKLFTVDDIDNKQMLAKYNFVSRDGKKYSLLKLYSFAQAYSGDRVAGSIYGVALLSENDIALNKTNFNILSNAKSSFAKLCLNGYKFKSSDFYDEVYKIWGALINHNEGNYLDKVVFSNRKISNINLDVKGFYLKNLFEDAVSLENQMNTASRIYMSEDLEHLKRTNLKWGNDFKIYTKTVSGYEIYQEPKPVVVSEPKTSTISNQNSTISEEQKLKIKVSDQEHEILELKESLISEQKKHKKSILYSGVLISILFLTTVTFFFKNDFFVDDKTPPGTEYYVDEPEVEQGYKENQVNLNDILANDANRNTLNNLLQNIKKFEISLEFDKKKYSEEIISDAKILGLDPAFYEAYIIKDIQVEANGNADAYVKEKPDENADVKTKSDSKEKETAKAKLDAKAKAKADTKAKQDAKAKAKDKSDAEAKVKSDTEPKTKAATEGQN